MQDLHVSVSKTIKRTWSQQWRHQCFNGIRISEVGSKIRQQQPTRCSEQWAGHGSSLQSCGEARLTHWLPGKSARRHATHCSFDKKWLGPGQVCAKISHMSRMLVKQALVQRQCTENKRNTILSGLSLLWIKPHILETSRLISPPFLGFSPHLFLGASVERSGWLFIILLPSGGLTRFCPYKMMGRVTLTVLFPAEPKMKRTLLLCVSCSFLRPQRGPTVSITCHCTRSVFCAWAAIQKYHTLGGSSDGNLLFTVLDLGSLRSTCLVIRFLVRERFLVYGSLAIFFLDPHMVERASMHKLSRVASYKNTNLLKLGFHPYGLMNYNCLHNGPNSKHNYKAYWSVNM